MSTNQAPLPAHHSPVYHTQNGTPYLRSPGIVMIGMTRLDLSGIQPFLEAFNPELGFSHYLDDPAPLSDPDQLIKFAGQLCYMSFGPNRTTNVDAHRYFDNIKSSGHGSVLEHANFNFLLYGIPRSLTHELVRHRAGVAFSQVSQRYVSGSVLRFVEKPEYQEDNDLHQEFENRIDQAAATYKKLTDALLKLQKEGNAALSADQKTDLRKKVQQAARSCLPNETEAPIVFTANGRAIRHIIEMRASTHAETEIRRAFYIALKLTRQVAPLLMQDYHAEMQPDGLFSVTTPYPKV